MNADGSLRRVYHGTRAPVFDKFHSPKTVWVGPGMNDVREIHEIYFTDNISVARTYGRVEEVHLSIERPLEIDAKGKRWGDIHPSHYISEAVVTGCDGVVVKNIRDAASGGGAIATTFIVFSPEQIARVTEVQAASLARTEVGLTLGEMRDRAEEVDFTYSDDDSGFRP